MKDKQWKNKTGQGYALTFGPFIIKVVSWHNYDFTEITLTSQGRVFSGRLAYSETEIQRHIETCKDEIQNILERAL
jgi:hypothetical protein